MSNSHRDQKGKRIASEIMGRGTVKVAANGRQFYAIGGEDVGSPIRKRDAKQDVSRARRRRMDEMANFRGPNFMSDYQG